MTAAPGADHFRRVDGHEYVGWWVERFRLPVETFAGLGFWQRGRSTVWAALADAHGLEDARVDAVGVPFLRVGSRLWKPPTVALRCFAAAARRNAVDVDDDEARAFLRGDAVELSGDDRRWEHLERGFLVVRYRSVPLGCGEWRGGDRQVLSCLPKGRRVQDPVL